MLRGVCRDPRRQLVVFSRPFGNVDLFDWFAWDSPDTRGIDDICGQLSGEALQVFFTRLSVAPRALVGDVPKWIHLAFGARRFKCGLHIFQSNRALFGYWTLEQSRVDLHVGPVALMVLV